MFKENNIRIAYAGFSYMKSFSEHRWVCFCTIEVYYHYFLIWPFIFGLYRSYDHMFPLKHILFYRRTFAIGCENSFWDSLSVNLVTWGMACRKMVRRFICRCQSPSRRPLCFTWPTSSNELTNAIWGLRLAKDKFIKLSSINRCPSNESRSACWNLLFGPRLRALYRVSQKNVPIKFSPTALNFGYDFVLLVHFF